MTVKAAALAALAADPGIRATFAKTSPGDRSVLGAALDHEKTVLVTSAGSANDAFWACLMQHGWIEEGASGIGSDLPPLPRTVVERKLTEAGRRALPVIPPILHAEC